MNSILLDTTCGVIEGISEQDHNKFLGIRYGKANRFEVSREVKEWEGIYPAKSFGAACIQRRTFFPEKEDSFYYQEFRKGIEFKYSEDCQFLNIWTPKTGKKLPVILYIHGGAFQSGCGNEKPFDGQFFAKRGIVFVTCNYRLGPLGFAVTEENGDLKGNFGLSDQLTALEWLVHNVESFGGDSKNITLMGQSAGAMSIQQLVCSPLAKPFIAKAIMTSGGGIGLEFAKAQPIEAVREFWKKIELSLDSKALDWKKVPVELLFSEVQELSQDLPNAIEFLSPTVDGEIILLGSEKLKSQIIESNIPYLLGTTQDDMLKDILYSMAEDWKSRRNRYLPNSTWQFYFARNLPGDDSGAWHSSELWYTIGALGESWRPMTEWDFEISNKLMQYITNFVRTGNPNDDTLPNWSNSDKFVLKITDKSIE